MRTLAKQPIRTAAAILLLLVLVGGHVPGAAWSAAGQPPSVLVLNSYHQGYEWSDNEIEGVREGLRTAYPDIVPAIEHLDLKRFPAEDHQARLSGFMSAKYRNAGVDLAIVLDNPAFDILLKHRDEILPGVPVIFAGVNDFSPEMVGGRSGITGIAEVQDHAGTLALALRLHPGTRRVLAVHDYTASGLAVRHEMEAALPAFRGRVRVDFNDPARYDEVARQIAELQPGSLALILSFATDRAGKALTIEQSTAVLTAQARVPVYAMHETRLGHGIVGGMLLGGAEHGRRAAALALRVLAGEDPASIPVETHATSRPMFDQVQLDRFGIVPAALPPGSVVVGRPVSFYEQYKTILWGASGIIAVLLALIGCLLAAIARKNRAERALRASEERYRQVVEIIPDSIAIFVDERFAFVNASTMELLGAETPDRLIGRQIWDFCHPAYRSLGKNRFKQCQEEVAALPLAEFELIRLDGQARTIESAAVPIVYKNQRAVLSVWRDITLRRQMEHALRESEARFRLLYEKAPLPYQSLDRNGDFIEVNDAFLQALGYTRAEVIGRNFGEFLAPEWRDHFKQNFPRFKAVGEILGIEFEMVKRDGSRALVSFNGKIAFDRNGRFQQTHCIFTDITERRRTEAALVETTARLKEAQKIARIGQWELDLIANKLDWSDSIYELFEIAPDEFGASYDAFLNAVHPADRDRVAHAYTRSLADRTPYEIEHRLLMPDGRVKWVVEACRTDYDPEGKPVRSVGIVQDITDRKRAEEDLQAQRDMLETIFENSPFIMMLVDRDMRVRRVNHVGADFTRRPKAELIGLLCGEVVRCVNSVDGLGCGRNTVCGECLVRSQVLHTLRTGEAVFEAQGKFVVIGESGESMLDMLVSTARVKVAEQDFVLVSMFDITERVRAGEELHASEERYRLLFGEMTSAFALHRIILDESGKPCDYEFLQVNPAFEKLTGLSAGDVVGRRVSEVLPDIEFSWIARYGNVVLTGEPLQFEDYNRPLDKHFEVRAFKAGPGQFAVVFQDITERKLAAEALIESETNFRLLVETAPDAIFIQTAGRFAYLNSAALKLFGAESAGQIVGRPLLERIHPDFHATAGERSRVLNDDRRPVSTMQQIYLKMDQSPVEIEVSAVPFKFKGDNGALAFVRDVSHRKKAEAALRESEEKYRLLVQNALDAIFISQDGAIKFPNPKAVEWFGLGSEQPETVSFESIIHPEDRAVILGMHRRRQAGEAQTLPKVCRVVGSQGKEFWVMVSAVSIEWDGRPAELNFVRDITAQKKLEDQLTQAQKMEAIGTLAGGIAHDFNNILSVIIGNSEILNLTDAVTPSARDSLNQIMAASQRARLLVKQILAFSRHARQERLVINLKPIVKETIDFLRASLPTTIQLKHYLDPKSGQILGDPTQIQQVLMNLCTNAGHAMEKEGGVLEIILENVELGEEDARLDSGTEAGRYLRLTVSDNGHGIDPVILPRIFEPYFTTKEQGKGTGLGLSVVHGIVKSHSGTIKVYTEVGKGTSFRVYFPLAEDLDASEAAEPRPLPTGSERILFVDDEPALVDLSRRMLSRLGYEVDTRTSPVEALEAFRANPKKFNLVITDMTMPGMTGLMLAKKLNEISPGVPIVLCTGFSDQANEHRAQALGVRGFLLKPIIMRDLAEAVRKALDERR